MIGTLAQTGPTATATDPFATTALLLALAALTAALVLLRLHGRPRRRRLGGIGGGTATPYVAQRDELLATLGHELRSPLRALLALLDGDASADSRQELRGLAAHALRVAEDSLDFALLERGAVNLRPTRMDLEEVLGEVLAVVRPQRGDGVALELDVAPGLRCRREGDAARLTQILVNLVANALAHTAHGAVRVTVDPLDGDDADTLRFVVRDSGTGMTPTERHRAFRPFEQGDRPRGRAGIGLAVVARLVEAMGGEVFLESEPGLGSRFLVDLPLPEVDAAPEPGPGLAGHLVGLCATQATDLRGVAAHLQHWDAEPLRFESPDTLVLHLRAGRPLDGLVLVADDTPAELTALLEERARGGLSIARSTPADAAARLPGALARDLLPSQATREPATSAGLEVLVVDDHPVVRAVLGDLLRELGCTVTCAEDGASAVEIARDPEERFDWVLLDRRMPGLDGLATAALLREASATRDARIALLVNDAGDDPGSAELFDQVLVRPRRPDALRNLLALTLSRGHRPARPTPAAQTDASLATLRDETLAEDLAALGQAHEGGDDVEVAERLHRMEGALRLCPDEGLRTALQTLRTVLRSAPAGTPEAIEHFSALLAGAPDSRPISPPGPRSDGP